MKKKGILGLDILGYIIIGAAFLFLMAVLISKIHIKGVGAIEYFKNLIRFG